MTSDAQGELNALRDELRFGEGPSAANTEATELETALAELRESLAGAAQHAEEMVAEHPMAAVAAAFVIGLVVGRLSGISR